MKLGKAWNQGYLILTITTSIFKDLPSLGLEFQMFPPLYNGHERTYLELANFESSNQICRMRGSLFSILPPNVAIYFVSGLREIRDFIGQSTYTPWKRELEIKLTRRSLLPLPTIQEATAVT